MKENMNRRAFIGSSVVLAGGAALGIAGDLKLRKIGPVDLNFVPFWGKSSVLPVFIHVDERNDCFGIGFVETGNEVAIPLSAMHKAIQSRCVCSATIKRNDGSTCDTPTDLFVADGRFVIVAGTPPAPYWFDLKDIRRVLS